MKTQTNVIELEDVVQLSSKTYRAFYAVNGEENVNDIEISREKIIDHVIESEINVIDVLIADYMEYEQMPVSAAEWVDENLKVAVLSYLQSNLAA